MLPRSLYHVYIIPQKILRSDRATTNTEQISENVTIWLRIIFQYWEATCYPAAQLIAYMIQHRTPIRSALI